MTKIECLTHLIEVLGPCKNLLWIEDRGTYAKYAPNRHIYITEQTLGRSFFVSLSLQKQDADGNWTFVDGNFNMFGPDQFDDQNVLLVDGILILERILKAIESDILEIIGRE